MTMTPKFMKIIEEQEKRKAEVFEIEVTPELAAMLLESRHENQRKLNPQHVAALCTDMAEFRWRPTNPDPICITIVDRSYRLTNGQHRLAAVVKFGKPVRMLFSTDTCPEDFLVMDGGKNRGLHQRLQISGHTDVTSSLASTVMEMLHLSGRRDISFTAKQEHILGHKDAVQYTMECFEQGGSKSRVGIAPVKGVIARAVEAHPSKKVEIKDFVRVLLSGEADSNNPYEHNAILLRNRLLDPRRSWSHRAGKREAYQLTQTALYKFIRRERIERLKATEDELFAVLNAPMPLPPVAMKPEEQASLVEILR